MLNCQILIEKLLRIKHLLFENELKKLKTSDSSYFHGKNYFKEDGTQNFLVFQPIARYVKTINVNYVLLQRSKGLSDEEIDYNKTANYILNSYFDVYNMVKVRKNFMKAF